MDANFGMLKSRKTVSGFVEEINSEIFSQLLVYFLCLTFFLRSGSLLGVLFRYLKILRSGGC
jgi:hypothetical protein